MRDKGEIAPTSNFSEELGPCETSIVNEGSFQRDSKFKKNRFSYFVRSHSFSRTLTAPGSRRDRENSPRKTDLPLVY